MRKSAETQRFQNSAVLFRFCLRVFESKNPNKKIHDQEIGNILQYNPSDTSHWKRGKKSVKSIYAHEALAKELSVDIELIQDLCDGVLDADEAWFDYLDIQEQFRFSEVVSQELQKERVLRKMFYKSLASQLLDKANINTIPVHIPEILSLFPFIQVVQGEVSDKIARSSRLKANLYSLRYRKGEMRAHTRLSIVREIAKIIVYSERESFHLPPLVPELVTAEVMDFSQNLLVSSSQLRLEVANCSTKAHMVKNLADLFWVPKSVIRSSLKDLILSQVSPTRAYESSPLKVLDYLPAVSAGSLLSDLSDDDSSV